MRPLITTLIVLNLAAATLANAEWIGLADSARPTPMGTVPAGLEAFSAFGCAECHESVAEQGYQSGFRVVDEADQSLAALEGQAFSPVTAAANIILDGKSYERALDNPSLYIHRTHQHVPAAFDSVDRFRSAELSRQEDVIDYMFMF